MALTVGSLFSGIGGIDLGLERAGMDTRWFCEIDPHCRNVLARHWPGVPIYGDITAVDWSAVEPVDVVAGGFPCQPISNAGKRLAQEDSRWLWPAFARAIRAVRPRYVLVENVRNLLAVNGGTAFGEVLGDLAALGYDAEWDCIPASAVGAPHRRDRLWLLAYANRSPQRPEGRGRVGEVGAAHEGEAPQRQRPRAAAGDSRADVQDAFGSGLEGHDQRAVALADYRRQHADPAGSGWWSAEPAVGRVADGIPHRVERLRALGNAVVPQVVEWIGRRIVAFDEGQVA